MTRSVTNITNVKRLKEQRLLDPVKNTTKKCNCYHIVLESRLQRERAGITHEESGWQAQIVKRKLLIRNVFWLDLQHLS